MKKQQVVELLQRVRDHHEEVRLIVAGSQALYGTVQTAPAVVELSIEADCCWFVRRFKLARNKALDLPTYWGGVNPKLTAQTNAAGSVTSVQISYPRDAVKQYLEYGAMYRQ